MSTRTPIAQPAEARPKPRRKRPVPAALIRETINGIPFYYRGYRDVLNKKQTLDDISADCAIHVLIKKYFYDLLSNALDHSLFTVFVGEIGVQTEPKNQFSLGLAGYEMAQLPGEKFGFGYFDVLPKFVIEIDMKVSLDESGVENFAQFLNLKTQKLFDSGVERLVWVISANKKWSSPHPAKIG